MPVTVRPQGQQANPYNNQPDALLSRQIDAATDQQQVPATQGQESASGQGTDKPARKSRFSWTNDKTAAFVNILVDMTRAGKRSSNGWKKVVWNLMVDQFQVATNCTVANSVLITKERELKQRFTQFHRILENSSGWAITYDGDTHRIDCTDRVWEDYVIAHPESASLRDKPFAFYKELEEVFSTSTATGQYAQHAVALAMVQPATEESDLDNSLSNSQTALRPPLSELPLNSPTQRSSDSRNDSPGSNSKKKSRNPLANSINNAVSQLAMMHNQPIQYASPVLRRLVKENKWSSESLVSLTRFIAKDNRALVFNLMTTNEERTVYLRQEWEQAYPDAGLAIFAGLGRIPTGLRDTHRHSEASEDDIESDNSDDLSHT